MTQTTPAPQTSAQAEKPNYKWFSDKFRDRKLTQSAVARTLGVDPSTLSLVLHGKRRMLLSYANELARLLGVSVDDIIRNAGMYTGPADAGTIRVVGTISGSENISMDWKSKDFTVDLDIDLPRSAVALQWRTIGTPCELWDGWLVIIPPRAAPDASAMLDRYCVVQIKDGPTVIRKVRRGFAQDRYTLLGAFVDPMTDVEIEWFSPVLMVRPI